MGQGPQNNESAAEQAKDEVISDMIRDKYKGVTGSDFPIADKQAQYGGGAGGGGLGGIIGGLTGGGQGGQQGGQQQQQQPPQ